MKVKITLMVLVSLLSTCFIAHGGNNRGEMAERLWSDNEKVWEKSFKQSLHISDADFKTFISFYSLQFSKSRAEFVAKAFRGEISEGNALEYFNRLTTTYKALYKKFLQIKKDYPGSVEEYASDRDMYAPHATTGACNPACTNLDFSSGNLSGWNAYYAANDLSLPSSFGTSAMTGGPAGAVTTAAADPSTGTNQVTIMSGLGVDPYAGALIPVAAPLGAYSARVGDTTAGFGVGELTNQFTVPSVPNPVLTIQYAVVLEHTYLHTYFQQPWFQVQVLDASGTPIPGCGQYFVVAYDTLGYLKNFVPIPHPVNGDTMYCRPWTSVFVPLNGYQGQCVSMSFEASDCNGGAHMGYAYVAASCSQLQVQSTSTVFCGQSSITLSAPPGGTYSWSGPCITGPTNQQTATVTCAGTYTVIVSNATTGPTCSDTLTINVSSITGTTPPKPFFTADTVCAGTPTTFVNLSNPITGAGVKFYWDFFNNGKYQDSSTSPTWTFTQGGVYLVTLHETVNGCGMDTTIKVIVDTANTLSFSAFGSCAGQPSSFFLNGTATSAFEWNFGDPASGANDTSTSSFPSHVYTSAGTYTVSLKTIGVHCADSTMQTVVVGASPTVKIWSSQTVCSDSAITFKDIDSLDIAEYEWEFYNSTGTSLGFTFSTSSATTNFTFPGPGSYYVVAYVFGDTTFCESVDTFNLTVGNPPIAAFNTLPDSACIHKPVIFTDASTGGPVAWGWNFGDPTSGINNTSTKQNPVHIFSTPGTYTIRLVDNPGAGCTDTITHTIVVTEVSGNFNTNNVCLHDSTQFANASTVTNGNIKGWLWNFGDGNTSTLQNPAHLYGSAGTYNVTLTVTSTTGCDSTIIEKVTVSPSPVPSFSYTKACLGTPTKFTDLSTTSTGTVNSWSWSFGDGGNSVLQNPSHTYGAGGTYMVVLTVTSSSGCVDSIKQKVFVSAAPVVAFSADTLSGCPPLCVKFTDASIAVTGKDTGWHWNFGAGGTTDTSSSAVTTYCYKSPGKYSVSLTVSSDSGCSASATVKNMISVYTIPKAAFTTSSQPVNVFDPSISFYNQSFATGSDSIVSNMWLFKDDDSIAHSFNTSHYYHDTGTYCVELTVKNTHGCVDSTENCVEIDPVFTFYIPNAFTPNGNGLNEFFGPEGKYVKIFDMYIFNRWGNMIYHTSDMTKPWDGTYLGDKAQEDTYVYEINVTDTENGKHSYIGRVTLIR